MDSLCKEEEMETKAWYTSKTLWVNLIAIGTLLGSQFTEFDIPPEISVGILAAINVILRVATKKPVEWANPISRIRKKRG